MRAMVENRWTVDGLEKRGRFVTMEANFGARARTGILEKSHESPSLHDISEPSRRSKTGDA